MASDLARSPLAVAWLDDGAIAVLSLSGLVEVIDERGRISSVLRLPQPPERYISRSLRLEASGTLLVAWNGRVWRIDLRGQAIPLTARPSATEGTGYAHGVDALSDGGFLFTRDAQVFRRWPDGRTEAVAGSSRSGWGRAGPALRSPLQQPSSVVAVPAGGFVFSDVGGIVWAVDAHGQMQRLAGGGGAREISRAGRPARSVLLSEISGIAVLPDGQIALSSVDGVFLVANGRIREYLQGPDGVSTPRMFPPLWSGAPAGRAWLAAVGAVDRNANGEWLIPSETGIVMITARDPYASRLAVALSSSTQRFVWHRRLDVTSTAAGSARVRVRSRGRLVATISGQLSAGRTAMRVPRRLPGGVLDLEVRAVGADGAVASHSMRVLGKRRLPVAVARRSLLAHHQPSFDLSTVTEVSRCVAKSTTRVNCVVKTSSESDTDAWRARVALRRDGWLWTTERGSKRRIELI